MCHYEKNKSQQRPGMAKSLVFLPNDMHNSNSAHETLLNWTTRTNYDTKNQLAG